MTDVQITVRGTHIERVPPERATVRARVERDGPDPDRVIDQVAAVAAEVRTSIEPMHDPEAGPVTAWTSDQIRTWSSRPWNQDGEQLPIVHSGQITFEVTFSDFAALGRWCAETAQRGATIDGVTWTLTPERERELRDAVLTAAVADATAKAAVYAHALGLGPVKVVAVADSGMLADRSRPVAEPRMMAMKSAGIEMAPGPVELSAEVDARFVV